MGDPSKVLKYNQSDKKIGPRKKLIIDRLFIKTDEVVSPKETRFYETDLYTRDHTVI